MFRDLLLLQTLVPLQLQKLSEMSSTPLLLLQIVYVALFCVKFIVFRTDSDEHLPEFHGILKIAVLTTTSKLQCFSEDPIFDA